LRRGIVDPLPASAGKRALRVLTEAVVFSVLLIWAVPTGVFVNGERIVRYGPLELRM
jgi:pilus assembly protein CpaF